MATGSECAPPELRQIDTEDLVSLAEALRDLGVSEFSWGGAHVKFAEGLAMVRPQVQTVQRDPAPTPARKPVDVYHDPMLWNGGKPPVFPGSVEKDET